MGKADPRRQLQGVRRRIDAIDSRVVALLEDRMLLALAAAACKKRMGETVAQPAREAEVIRRVLGRRKRIPAEALTAIWHEIMGAARALEEPFTLAVFGPAGTNTHLAALRRFGHGARLIFESTIPDVFQRVEKSDADAGIVPVENSTEGAIVSTLDALVESSLVIAGEVLLPVHNHLLMHPASLGRRPRRIVSHPQPLAQCRNWLEANFSGVPLEATSTTAHAARLAAEKPGVAAIANELAAEKYGLAFRHRNIEDRAENTTRFLILQPAATERTAPAARAGRGAVAHRTSIAFSMKDRPGALFAMLSPFQRQRVNLTKIESRPSRSRNWRYIFFVDMEGRHDDPRVRRALAQLETHCSFYRLLGSYPEYV